MPRKKMQEILNDLMDSAKRGQPYLLTFEVCPGMTKKDKASLEASLKRAFKLWSSSWIIPRIIELQQCLIGGSK